MDFPFGNESLCVLSKFKNLLGSKPDFLPLKLIEIFFLYLLKECLKIKYFFTKTEINY